MVFLILNSKGFFSYTIVLCFTIVCRFLKTEALTNSISFSLFYSLSINTYNLFGFGTMVNF